MDSVKCDLGIVSARLDTQVTIRAVEIEALSSKGRQSTQRHRPETRETEA
jgi:hypothetical protein